MSHFKIKLPCLHSELICRPALGNTLFEIQIQRIQVLIHFFSLLNSITDSEELLEETLAAVDQLPVAEPAGSLGVGDSVCRCQEHQRLHRETKRRSLRQREM